MRYLKVLILALIFVASMIFFIQNTPIFSETIQLQLEILGYRWTSVAMPIYLVVLLSFLLGAVLAILYFFIEKVRLSGMLRSATAKVKKLEDEVASLRAAQETPSYSSYSNTSSASSDSVSSTYGTTTDEDSAS
ncbi:protein of unknown function DUF1049 [Desulfovibrio sp. X2]|uniref:LapA family protein n=1 Tax=Desulfovibrio sp. X2 TaxID=941449 RepID=UPI00035896B9|nr:LapA family protein [Desulfovibrio sp. X2]EPR42296.1 protein of unknown function DUF1049 [Desulfovibrio sp. X2]